MLYKFASGSLFAISKPISYDWHLCTTCRFFVIISPHHNELSKVDEIFSSKTVDVQLTSAYKCNHPHFSGSILSSI